MLRYLVLSIVLLFNLINTKDLRVKRESDVEEEASLTVPEIIQKYGYPCDIYEITTEDGYILEVHRVPYGKKKVDNEERVPVIIQHGLLGSSADFIVMGVEKALVYLLVDEGYDVWLINCRGNVYSRKHSTLDPNFDSDYWRFSFHEIGIYDIPAVIDFVLSDTNQQQLFHIGHSQGSTSFYVMTAERPEYNDKIIAHFSYAPAAYETNMRSPFISMFAKTTFLLTPLLHLIGLNEFLPGYQLLTSFAPLVCSEDVGLQEVCSNGAFLLLGFNKKELNYTLLPTLFGHFPAGASTDQFIHYGQEITSGRFCQYDHGILENMIRYNEPSPPDYDISKITTPLYFFYSDGDIITDSRDVEKFSKEVPNLKELIKMDDPEWSHLDYSIGISAKEKIYLKTLNFMKRLAH